MGEGYFCVWRYFPSNGVSFFLEKSFSVLSVQAFSELFMGRDFLSNPLVFCRRTIIPVEKAQEYFFHDFIFAF